ncbi:MAG: glutaminase [Candidatus Eiseniibacteriota bacterium]
MNSHRELNSGVARCAGLVLALAWILNAGAADAAKSAAKSAAPAVSPTQTAVDQAYAKYKDLQEGKNADYIPALAKVDPNVYGIALITVDGKLYTAGDLNTLVSIQSISKVFTMAKVMEEQGPMAIENNMGVDATGQVFNSIVAVEQYKGAEMNAMVNPGAITATSMISGATPDEIWGKIIGTYSDFAGRPLTVLQDVYESEAATNQRNQAIAMLMYAYGHIKDKPLRSAITRQDKAEPPWLSGRTSCCNDTLIGTHYDRPACRGGRPLSGISASGGGRADQARVEELGRCPEQIGAVGQKPLDAGQGAEKRDRIAEGPNRRPEGPN